MENRVFYGSLWVCMDSMDCYGFVWILACPISRV